MSGRAPENAGTIVVFGLGFGGYLVWEYGPEVMAGTADTTDLMIGVATFVMMGMAMTIGYFRNQ